jgi:hypothetical protein
VDELRTGLRHRLKRVVRQILEQHRQLASLCDELRRALEVGGSADEALARLDPYRDAIEAHFGLEVQVFFPALQGLHPEWSAELGALEAEHGRLRAGLEALRAALVGAAAGDPRSGLETFVVRLAEHERREERLVAGLVEARPGEG